jgi:thiol-disulfide isomerase/thioredoxin
MSQLVFFTGEHCGSCKVVKQQLEEKMNGNGAGLEVRFVDVGDKEGAQLAAQHGVCGLPTILHMEGDNPLKSYVGNDVINKLVEDGVLH